MIVSGSLLGVGFYELNITDPLETEIKDPEPTLLPYMTPIEPQVGKFDVIQYPLIAIASSVGFSFLSVYLVIKWSKEWNETRK